MNIDDIETRKKEEDVTRKASTLIYTSKYRVVNHNPETTKEHTVKKLNDEVDWNV